MKNKNEKKELKLQKETLVRLQEDQMKSLLGAENMTTQSGAVCDNDVEITKIGRVAAIDESCCRRSCRK